MRQNAKLKVVNAAMMIRDDLESYVAQDNARLKTALGVVAKRIESEQIRSVLAFKDARFEDRWHHDVNQLVYSAMGSSQAVSRLEFLIQQNLPDQYDGACVGSTGTPGGDFDKLLELVANASYLIGVLQGAKLQGATEERLEEIQSLAAI